MRWPVQNTASRFPHNPRTTDYRGITFHAGKWLVKLRHKGMDVTIGHLEDPLDAAWTADFARYMAYGVDPHTWPHRGGRPLARPNFPPCGNDRVDRWVTLRILFVSGILDASAIAARLKAYDEVAARPLPEVDQNAASTASAS